METGKHISVTAPAHISSISAQTEKRMDGQAPLTAVYIHTVPAPPPQLLFQPPTIVPGPETNSIPSLYSKELLPLLTLHIVGGLQSQRSDHVPASSARPKSAGKHVCPHCGRDCMKPSVLEKHLRCHTGERPYPCTTCGVSFKTQSNLYKHKRTQAHARISDESGQSSQDSISSSRETSTSSSSLDDSIKQQGSLEEDRIIDQDSLKTQTEVSEQSESSPLIGPEQRSTTGKDRGHKPSLMVGRHLTLQRQEATFFSKQWETTTCKVKSQSHESTDSGFSESSDHNPSPSTVMPHHSMESLIESTLECPDRPQCITSEECEGGPEPKDNNKEKEQRTLEERISQLISENSAVVEDKQLENVRPRKTALSKQGSIDLPMPYTYKDSFHFDMRISKSQNVGLRRPKYPGLYSSVPTQPSTNTEHAPLTRSNSLPFSVALLQPEGSNQTLFSQADNASGFHRGSSVHLNPPGLTTKPVNQQSSTHRLLVRQSAVDCNLATEALFLGSSIERATSCDGDSTNMCGEPSGRKFRKQKSQKFAYNKWYMYGGGTFRKLYSTGAAGDSNVVKGRKPTEAAQVLQKSLSAGCKEITTCSAVPTSSGTTVCSTDINRGRNVSLEDGHLHCSSPRESLRKNLSLSALPTFKPAATQRANTDKFDHNGPSTDALFQLSESKVPSDRKKPRTNQNVIYMESSSLTPSYCDHGSKQDTNLSHVSHRKDETETSPLTNVSALSVITSSASYMPVSAKTSSFLPKYQLKLPNATEHGSAPEPPQTLSRSPTHTPPLSNKIIASTANTNFVHPVTLETNVLFQASPRTEMSRHSSTLAVSHRPFAGNTITTTCRSNARAGVCSTSVQSSLSSPVVKTPPTTAGGTTVPSLTNLRLQTPPPATTSSSPASSIDLTPPADQRVFHVHTADLHICFQLISDEQLALIEPQIERQEVSTERATMEDTPAKAQSSAQVNNDTKTFEKTDNQKSLKETASFSKMYPQSLLTQTLDNPRQEDQNNSTLASGLPKVPRQPEKHSHANTCSETWSRAGHIVSTAAAIQSPKSDENQISKHHRPMNCNEERTLPGEVRQSGLASQVLPGQHQLIIRPPSQGMVNKSEITSAETKHKQTIPGGLCRDGQIQGGNKTVEEETQGLCRTQPTASSQKSKQLTELFTKQHKISSEDHTGEIAHRIPEAPSEALLKHIKPGCDTLLNWKDSFDAQVPGGLRPVHVPHLGLLDSAAVVPGSTQRQQQAKGSAEIPGRPDGADTSPQRSQELRGEPAEAEGSITGAKSSGEERLDGRSEVAKTSGTHIVPTEARGEDRKAKAEPPKNIWLSDPHISQTKSGMSKCPPLSTERVACLSNNQNLCSSSTETRLSNSPQTEVKMNHSYFSGHLKDVDAHHQQTLICERIIDDAVIVPDHSIETCASSLIEPTRIHDVTQTDHQPVQHDTKRGAPGGGNAAACRNTVAPSQPAYSQHHSSIPAATQSTYQEGYSRKSEAANPCHSFLLAAHFHSYQLGPSSTVRPVQACPDYTEDTSSSDEEGKLIIEL
ncbi:zinc finger protein 831 [Synchiropus picturatus]